MPQLLKFKPHSSLLGGSCLLRARKFTFLSSDWLSLVGFKRKYKSKPVASGLALTFKCPSKFSTSLISCIHVVSNQPNVILQASKSGHKKNYWTTQAKWVGLNWIEDSFRQDSDVYVYQYLQRVGKCSGNSRRQFELAAATAIPDS